MLGEHQKRWQQFGKEFDPRVTTRAKLLRQQVPIKAARTKRQMEFSGCGYLTFQAKRRAELRAGIPGKLDKVANTNLQHTISAEWKALTPEQRAEYLVRERSGYADRQDGATSNGSHTSKLKFEFDNRHFQ